MPPENIESLEMRYISILYRIKFLWQRFIHFTQDIFHNLLNHFIQIDKATNVIIVGGGAVGVELAGEIAERYSAKLVSIIHKRSYLVSPSYGDQFQRKVKNVLKDRSVQALLGNLYE